MTKSIPAVVLAAVVVLAGCGGGDDSSAPVTIAVETTVETPGAPPPPPAAKPKPARPKEVVIVVDQGRPRGGIQRPELERGAKIVLVIRSDLGESVHVHGYDLERAVPSGRPLRIPMTLTIAGRFEVELHHPDALLAVLEVRP